MLKLSSKTDWSRQSDRKGFSGVLSSQLLVGFSGFKTARINGVHPVTIYNDMGKPIKQVMRGYIVRGKEHIAVERVGYDNGGTKTKTGATRGIWKRAA